MAQADNEGFQLRGHLDTIARRKWTIVAVTAAVILCALVLSIVQTRVYTASAEVLLEPRPTESVFAADNPQSNPAASTVETETQVLRSDGVRSAVRRAIGSVPKVSASRVGETEVMKVSAQDTDARRAARIANAYVNAYIDFRKRQAVGDLAAASASIQTKITSLQDEIDALEQRLPSVSGAAQTALQARYTTLLTQQGLLAQKLDSLQVDATLKSGGAQLVKAAAVPRTPTNPKPLRNALIALLVGAVVGTALAFLREKLDDSVKNKRELADALPDVPVLGLVPVVDGWDDGSREVQLQALRTGATPAAEAYRDLRTSVQLVDVERSLRTVQVTSPAPQEGKTTVVGSLGVVLAVPGQRILLVDCDLRRPALHKLFGIPSERGFTSIFTDNLAPLDLVQLVPGEDSLYLLPSGPIPTNPSELVGSKRTAEILFELQSAFDLVIVDSPPVLPVTDAIILAAWVEATLLVAQAGSTTSKQLNEAAERLARVDARVVGTVLNQAPPDAASGYSYGYRYAERTSG